MILLEVGNSSVTNASHRLLTLRAACIALERRYPNHPRGEMHKVSSSHLPNATDRDPDNLDVFCRPSSLDVQFVDFDNVRFHLSTPDRKTQLLLSMNIRCWGELAQYGAVDVLRREYGSLYLETPEPDYHVSLTIDLEQIPPEGGACPVTTASVDGTDIFPLYQRPGTLLSIPLRCSRGTPWPHRLSERSGNKNSWRVLDLIKGS